MSRLFRVKQYQPDHLTCHFIITRAGHELAGFYLRLVITFLLLYMFVIRALEDHVLTSKIRLTLSAGRA